MPEFNCKNENTWAMEYMAGATIKKAALTIFIGVFAFRLAPP